MKIVEDFKTKVNLSINKLKEDLSGIRSGRPNSTLIENIKVDCYGQQLTIKQLASVGVNPPRQLFVQPWDEGIVGEMIKAIEESIPGASVAKEEKSIRVNLPELSEERKKEFIKRTKQLTEECRIEIRRLRDDAKKEIQALLDGKEITEDQKFKFQEGIQKEVDEANKKAEQMLENKIEDLNK